MAIIVERITCEKIVNGEMCKVPDGETLQDIISGRSLSTETMTARNGERIVLSNPDGSWAGTAVKYNANDGFLLFKKD